FRRSLLSVLSTRILPPPRSTLFPYTTLFRSQFEQHLRAVLDLPLGCPEMTAEVAVMANVLGSQLPDPSSAYPEVMRTYPEAKVHLYGKSVRPGRKLGHVTVTGADAAQARKRAQDAARMLRGE